MSPEEEERWELSGGVVLIGRPSLKEYVEGLRRGWLGGVEEWDWEREVRGKLEAKLEAQPTTEQQTDSETRPETTENKPVIEPTLHTPLSTILQRSTPPKATFTPTSATNTHTARSMDERTTPLPPIALLPFTSHLGFKQLPMMLYDFFTERYRVQAGADAAVTLIEGKTRVMEREDLDWGIESEKWYKKSWKELPSRIAQARKDFYDGEGKDQLKKELRWMGNEEGHEIVSGEVAWDDRFDGWLRLFV